MAEQGRREVVSDQLAFNAREQAPERTLATMGVRNPGQSGGPTRSASRALEGLMGALGGLVDTMNDDLITQGKMDFMSGRSEQAAIETGGHFGQQGWQSLDTVDKSNTWYMSRVERLSNGDEQMDPQAYKQSLMADRDAYLKDLPDDPQIRKLAVAAWEDKGPQLVAKQYEAHMAWNQGQAYNSLSNALSSGSAANADATRVMPGSNLRVSPSRVDTAIMGNESDRDAGILTMLGEAAGEGDVGMAAVAHVMKNRVTDKRWGGTVGSVAKADKQFSVWNDGGGALAKYRGTAAYERAGQIYDSVMGGFTVDMTGGATHYFAPKGMKGGADPDWFATESKRAGGGLRIGNHIFAGKSGMGGYSPKGEVPADGMTQVPMSAGALVFSHKGQEGIDPGFAGILKETSSFLGQPLKILSGHRDSSHPVEAAKASPGEHAHKDAVDIDMTGMSDEQKKSLVQDLRSRGVKRFIAYSTSPNMLHVDMNSKQVSPDDWFMFDKSNKNMGNAPDWFKQVAGEQTPTSKGAEWAGQASGTQVSSLLSASHLPPALKASALVDAIRRQFAQGSDQLFNDAGGIGKLYELGAKPQEIDEVLRAKETMEKKQLDGYDTGFERERSDLMAKVKAGEFKNSEDIIATVDDMYAKKRMNGSQAQSLVRAAQAELEKVQTGEDAVLPKEFMEETAAIYRKQTLGMLDTSEAYDAIAAAGEAMGVDRKTAQRFLSKVYSVDDSKFAHDRSEAEALRKKHDKDQDLMSRAEQAIANGAGGKNIPEGTVTYNGQDMTTKEYAITKMKEDIRDSIIRSGKTGDEAEGLFYKLYFTQLAHNGIVDEKAGDAMVASLRNLSPQKGKDGNMHFTKDALTAFDNYLTMTNDPEISDGYVARTFTDDKVRGFLEQAKQMYSLNLDLETAMLKAHESIANGNDPKKITHQYYADVQGKVDEAIKTAVGTNRWWTDLVPRFPFLGGVDTTTEKTLLTNERFKAETYIRDRADAYNAMQPGQTAAVSIKLAMDDFQNDMIQVRGQMIIGDHKQGKRIDQKMFRDEKSGNPLDYGPRAVNDAVNAYIMSHGKSMWPEFWQQGDDSMRTDSLGPSGAPVTVSYNPTLGLVGLQFHNKDGKPLGQMHWEDARTIGQEYRMSYLDQPGMLGELYDKGMDAVSRGGGSIFSGLDMVR